LGGYDSIAAIVTDYVSLLRKDPIFEKYATSRGTDKRARDLQLTIDYMCKVTGGAHYYLGRDMKTTHAGLGINGLEWKVNLEHLSEALNKHNVPAREKQEVLWLVEKMRSEIVEKE